MLAQKNSYYKSKCGVCLPDKSRFLKQNHNKKVVSNIIKKHADTLFKIPKNTKKKKKNQKC